MIQILKEEKTNKFHLLRKTDNKLISFKEDLAAGFATRLGFTFDYKITMEELHKLAIKWLYENIGNSVEDKGNISFD